MRAEGTGSSRGAGERQSLFPAGAAVHHQEQVSETAGNEQRAIQINVKVRVHVVGTGMAGGSSCMWRLTLCRRSEQSIGQAFT